MDEWIEITAKTVEEAVIEASLQLQISSDNLEYEIVEEQKKGLLGMFGKEVKIRAKCKGTVENVAKAFLCKVLKCMEIEADLDASYDEEKNTIDITINGEDMGILIGKRGQTLDSLQYLVSLVVNKESTNYIKVKLDTENYRERRKETLENLAVNISKKVKRTRKPVSLEPMNPYERRIIHSALQNDKFVETHSEGEEPYRKVVITLKKGVYTRNNRNNKNGRNNNYKKNYEKKDYKKKFRESYKKSYQNITFDDIYDNKSNNKTSDN